MKVGADFGAATMHAHAIGAAHATDELSAAADAIEGGKKQREGGSADGEGWNDDDVAAIGYCASHAIARVAVLLQHEINREIQVKRAPSFQSSEIPSI